MRMIHAEIYKNVYSRVAHVNIEVGTNEFKKNENLSYIQTLISKDSFSNL